MKKVKQNVQSVSEDEEFYTSWNGNHEGETSKIKVVEFFQQFFFIILSCRCAETLRKRN